MATLLRSLGLSYYVTCCYAAEVSGIFYYVTGCYAAEISGIFYYVTGCYAAEICGIVYYVTCCYAAEISGIVYYVTCCYAAEISGIVYYVTCCYAAEISGIVYYVWCTWCLPGFVKNQWVLHPLFLTQIQLSKLSGRAFYIVNYRWLWLSWKQPIKTLARFPFRRDVAAIGVFQDNFKKACIVVS